MRYWLLSSLIVVTSCYVFRPKESILVGDPSQSIHDILDEAIKQHVEVVELSEGIYYLDSTILLESPKIRSARKRLTIRAQQDARVILSGGKQVNWVWRRYNDSIMVASTQGESFSDLFLNGRKQCRARYPDYKADGSIFNGSARDALSAERVKKWNNPKGGYIHALHKHLWGGYHYQIKGKTKNDSLLYDGGWQNNRQMGMHNEYIFVENIFEELDAPGEWYHDTEQQLVYFFPENQGTDLNLQKVEISLLECIFHLKGSRENPIKNIHLEGLELAHVSSTFMKTKEPLLRSDWTIYRNGAILVEGGEDCTISQCSFSDHGGNGIFISNYNRNIQIRSCELSNLGASGICLVGNPEAVRNPNFEYHEFTDPEELDHTPGPKLSDYPQNCLVTDCLIRDIGRIEKQVAGVQIAMASEITISHNTIYNVPRSGINIGDGCWGGHLIEHNEVFNTVLETGDHGAFNSWGRDRYWYPNRHFMDSLVAADTSLILLDAQKPTQIRNNRFHCEHGWDIDLDDGSSNYIITNNVCLSGGIKLREGFYRSVYNNIMINNSFHPHVWFQNSHDVFERNIVMADYKPIRVNDWGKSVDYNFFADSLWLLRSQALRLDSHGVVGPLLFKNPENGDYSLEAASNFLVHGFKNIPMIFGVKSDRLRTIAQIPNFPDLFMANVSDIHAVETVEILGASLKNIESMGEMSALGLGRNEGVIVVDVKKNSKAAQSGMLAGDAILAIDNMKCRDIPDVMNGFQTHKWKQQVEITVFRNQQSKQLSVILK